MKTESVDIVNLDATKTCTFCGQDIHINRESNIKDINSTIFHVNCYGEYIAILYNRYQEVS